MDRQRGAFRFIVASLLQIPSILYALDSICSTISSVKVFEGKKGEEGTSNLALIVQATSTLDTPTVMEIHSRQIRKEEKKEKRKKMEKKERERGEERIRGREELK